MPVGSKKSWVSMLDPRSTAPHSVPSPPTPTGSSRLSIHIVSVSCVLNPVSVSGAVRVKA